MLSEPQVDLTKENMLWLQIMNIFFYTMQVFTYNACVCLLLLACPKLPTFKYYQHY